MSPSRRLTSLKHFATAADNVLKVSMWAVTSVYVSRAPGKLIVCPIASIEKGFYNGQQPLSLVSWDAPAEVLGQNVWESLLLFRKLQVSTSGRAESRIGLRIAFLVSGAFVNSRINMFGSL